MPSTDLHIGLTVTAIDDAVDFYAAVLGARLDRRFTPGPHPGVQALIGEPTADMDAAFITLGDGRTVELIAFRGQARTGAPPSPIRPGAVHFAATVPDLDGTLAQVVDAGGALVGRVVELDGRRSAYTRDPDGVLLELIELAEVAE